jgi:hypothetical protein
MKPNTFLPEARDARLRNFIAYLQLPFPSQEIG